MPSSRQPESRFQKREWAMVGVLALVLVSTTLPSIMPMAAASLVPLEGATQNATRGVSQVIFARPRALTVSEASDTEARRSQAESARAFLIYAQNDKRPPQGTPPQVLSSRTAVAAQAEEDTSTTTTTTTTTSTTTTEEPTTTTEEPTTTSTTTTEEPTSTTSTTTTTTTTTTEEPTTTSTTTTEEPTTTTTEEPTSTTTTSTTTTEAPTTTSTTEEPTSTTTTTEEPTSTSTTTTEEPTSTSTTTTEEPTTTSTTTTEEPTTTSTTTTTEEPTTTTTTTTTTEEPTSTTTTTTTTTTEEPTTTTTTTTTTEEPTTTSTTTTTTTTEEPTSTSTTTTTLPPSDSKASSGGSKAGIIAAVVVVVAVVALAGGAAAFYTFCLGGTWGWLCCLCGGSKRDVDDGGKHSDDEVEAPGEEQAENPFGNPLPRVSRKAAPSDFTSSSSASLPPAPNFPPCVADLPPCPIRVRGDPHHINRNSNRPYTVNGIVPWTGLPPVLRGPQPPCMVPTFTEDGTEIPREERVMPGPLLYETPPATRELPPSPKRITDRQRYQNKWRSRFGMKPFTDTVYPAPPRWYEDLSYAEWLPESPLLSDSDGSGSESDDMDGSDSQSNDDIEQRYGASSWNEEKQEARIAFTKSEDTVDRVTPVRPTPAAAVMPSAAMAPYGAPMPYYQGGSSATAMQPFQMPSPQTHFEPQAAPTGYTGSLGGHSVDAASHDGDVHFPMYPPSPQHPQHPQQHSYPYNYANGYATQVPPPQGRGSTPPSYPQQQQQRQQQQMVRLSSGRSTTTSGTTGSHPSAFTRGTASSGVPHSTVRRRNDGRGYPQLPTPPPYRSPDSPSHTSTGGYDYGFDGDY